MKVKEVHEINKNVDLIEFDDGSVYALVVYNSKYSYRFVYWEQDKESVDEFGWKITKVLIALYEESIFLDYFYKSPKPKIKFVKKKKNKRDIKNERKNLKRGKRK